MEDRGWREWLLELMTGAGRDGMWKGCTEGALYATHSHAMTVLITVPVDSVSCGL
jgi:hypothetical protein